MDPETHAIPAAAPAAPPPEGPAQRWAGHPAPNPVANAIYAWPADRPLAVLTAGRRDPGGPTPAARPRWTVLCAPADPVPIRDPDDLARLLAPPPPHSRTSTRSSNRSSTGSATPGACPFRSGRLVLLTYELGHALEPASGGRDQDSAPLGYVAGVECAHAFDHEAGEWTTPPTPPPGQPAGQLNTDRPPCYSLGPLASETGADAYRAAVVRALGYIRAGDVYQVNIAHPLSASFEGSPRALAADLFASAAPAHGVYAELPSAPSPAPAPAAGARTTAIVSASPELFVSYDPATRTVRTQPMKGTRPIAADPAELRGSEKDRAELDMITDLMRNDLGRVCAFGSMRVEASRTIEAHGDSVWQATSTIAGTLREGLTPADLVRAAFPPGSITGAPKVRAMQIIRELEPAPRGYYCGALGWLDDSGALSLNVGIRTATITLDADQRGHLTYHAGAGIVADSDPDAEWAETLGKADVITRHARTQG